MTTLYEKVEILRYLFGNAASALGIVSRALPYLSAFGEGFLIGLYTLFILVLAVTLQISIVIYTAVGAAIWGIAAFMPGLLVGTAAKLSTVIANIVKIFTYAVQRETLHLPWLVQTVGEVFNLFHLVKDIALVIFGLGLVASVLAPIYTVRKPRPEIPTPIWCVLGLCGYLVALSMYEVIPIVDIIRTCFDAGLNVFSSVIFTEFLKLIIWVITFFLMSFMDKIYMLAFTVIAYFVVHDAVQVATALMFTLILLLLIAAIVIYFSAMSLVPATFTQILVTIFQALGRRGVSSPGGALLAATPIAIFFAGLMAALILFGFALFTCSVLMMGIVLKVFVNWYGFTKVLKLLNPFEAFKRLFSNTIIEIIFGNLIALLIYELIRLAVNGIRSAMRSMGRVDPATCLGITLLCCLLAVMLATGAPGSYIIAELYCIFIPVMLMILAVHSSIAGPPTRARGATSVANMLLYGITFMLYFSAVAAVTIGLVVPLDKVAIDVSGLGNMLEKYMPFYILYKKAESAAYVEKTFKAMITSIETSIRNTEHGTRIVDVFTPELAVAAFMIRPATELETFRMFLEQHCPFTYRIFVAVGQNYDEFFKVEHMIYEAVRSGQENCNVPGHGAMKCEEAWKRLSEEYHCTLIYYRMSIP